MPADSVSLRLEGELTIASVSRHRPALVAALDAGMPVELDLEAVTHFDGAGLQLLMLAARDGRHRGQSVRVVASSRAVRDVLDLARLDDALQPLGCCCSCTELHG